MQVTKADLRRFALADSFLRCPICQETFSSSYGDYFQLEEDHVFFCRLGHPLRLQVRRTICQDVKILKEKK